MSLMRTQESPKATIAERAKLALAGEPGLSVKDLAERLGMNRQFVAGFLAALEERGEVTHRKVGPARIFFNAMSPR